LKGTQGVDVYEMKSKSQDIDKFFLILTIIFGAALRLFPVIRSDFPLVDGGMFFSMIRDLQAANYSLPVFTSYNHQQIVYAYPPFAFYFTGAVNSLTGIPLLKLIQWQPVVINVLTLVVVYYFAKRFTRSSTKGLLVTFIFSLTPNSYRWQIVGGGLTRSFGALFAFLFTYFAYRLFHDKDDSLFGIISAILSGALVALSHPEWALQAAFSGFLIFLLWGKDWRTFRKSAIIVFSILALTAFWWITMLQRYGIHTYLNVTTATINRLLFFLPFISLQFTGETITFIAVFALIGVFVAIARRDYFLLIWGMGCLLMDPRGGIPFSLLPFSILAMISITDLIAPFILKSRNSEDNPWWDFLKQPAGMLFFGFFAVFCIINAFILSNVISTHYLSSDEQKAMLWVKENSGYDDKFLVLGSQENPIHSSLTEWFPALADRLSITTVQGQEWFGKYLHAMDTFALYQQCLMGDFQCVKDVNQKSGLQENCIFISFENSPQKPEKNNLYLSLMESSQFNQVYSSSEVKIFCLKE
jgi:hypothetical protein